MEIKEKEQKILKFIYMVITDQRNLNRYAGSLLGNVIENDTVNLSDCIKYLEDKLGSD